MTLLINKKITSESTSATKISHEHVVPPKLRLRVVEPLILRGVLDAEIISFLNFLRFGPSVIFHALVDNTLRVAPVSTKQFTSNPFNLLVIYKPEP